MKTYEFWMERFKSTRNYCFMLSLAVLCNSALAQNDVERPANSSESDLVAGTQATTEEQKGLPGDRLTMNVNGKEFKLTGDILIDGGDGSLYFQQDTGRIWFVEPDQVKERVDSSIDAVPVTLDAMEKLLLEELPQGFRVYQTKHYVIAYQTELAYAKWLAQLYEGRLYRVFETFWQRKKKFELSEPQFPLVVLVFKSKEEYERYREKDLGPGQEMVAYYNFQSNRVAMYDLTLGGRRPGENITNRRIEEVLMNPAALLQVATIIHEATHQLAFNRGIQTRFADTPLWLNEGLAMFFEAPDVKNKRGWRRPGLVFDQRLIRFRNNLRERPANAIERLITSDDRLRDPATAVDTYAEAWAFNHFLLNRRSKDYVNYLRELSKKPPLSTADANQRVDEFKKHLGSDLGKMEKDFMNYIQKLK